MMIELKPRCVVYSLPDGDIRILVKDRLSDEILKYIAENPFDRLTLSSGSWGDVQRLIKYKDKIKFLGIESDDIDWDSVSELTEIIALNIGGRYKCGLEFSKLPKLKHLQTDWNDGYEETLKNLNSLKSLVITGYRESDFKTLGSMDGLESLELRATKTLTSLASISNFKKLKRLTILNCGKLKDIKEANQLPSLEYLVLDKCKAENDYSSLGGLKSVKEVVICGEMRNLKWLEKLETLTKLRFNCTLVDGDLDFLYNMPNLQLVVFNNKKNFSIKLKDIQKYLEDKGFDQQALRYE